MNLVSANPSPRGRRLVSQDGILAICVAGSMVLHVLLYGWVMPGWAAQRPVVPTDYFVIESWPALVRQPVSKTEAQRTTETIEKAPRQFVPPPSPRPPQPDPATVVQKSGILRALGALDSARLTSGSGLEGPSAHPPALPPASRADPGTAPALARKGGDLAVPVTVGPVKPARVGAARVLGPPEEPRVAASVAVGGMESSATPIDQRRLAAFVLDRVGGIRACYEAELRTRPGLEGRIRVRFNVLSTGALAQIVTIENTLDSAYVADCLVRIMRAWRTPFRVSETISVEYPFVFSSSRG